MKKSKRQNIMVKMQRRKNALQAEACELTFMVKALRDKAQALEDRASTLNSYACTIANAIDMLS